MFTITASCKLRRLFLDIPSYHLSFKGKPNQNLGTTLKTSSMYLWYTVLGSYALLLFCHGLTEYINSHLSLDHVQGKQKPNLIKKILWSVSCKVVYLLAE